MSTVAISYMSLGDASAEASKVAKKLNAYADSLHTSVYNKLNNYSGSWTSNVSNAFNQTSNKITELRDEATKYETYSSNLSDLKDKCKEVDKSVKSSVSSLTASFRDQYNIKAESKSIVRSMIDFLVLDRLDDTAFGRWISKEANEFAAELGEHKRAIKHWFNYEGGKDLVVGVTVAGLAIVIGVLSLLTFGTIAAGIAALITTLGAIVNLTFEIKAYGMTKNSNDPATGKRLREVDSLQDYLRSSFLYGDDGDEYEYNMTAEVAATSIDVVNTICAVVSLASSIKKLLGNGYKWATGEATSPKNWKKLFSKEEGLFSKGALNGFKSKITNIKASFKARGFGMVKDISVQMFKDFKGNLKKEYLTFERPSGDFDMESTLKSIKNLLKLPHDLLDKGLNWGNLGDIAKDVILVGITAFTVNSTDTSVRVNSDGQIQMDFTKNITGNDLWGIGEKVYKMPGKINKTFESVYDLFSSSTSEINISVPVSYVPNSNLQLLRTH